MLLPSQNVLREEGIPWCCMHDDHHHHCHPKCMAHRNHVSCDVATHNQHVWQSMETNRNQNKLLEKKARMGSLSGDTNKVFCSSTKEASSTIIWHNPSVVEANPNAANQATHSHEAGGISSYDPYFNLKGPRESIIRELKNDDFPTFLRSLSSTCSEVQLNDAIKAVKYFQQGCKYIPSNIFFQLLGRCINENDLAAGREVYLLIQCSGLESDAFLGSHLVRMFTHFENLYEAKEVFSKLVKPNVFSWSAIISAHVKLGDNVQAIGLYKQMLEGSVEPDGHVFVDVLKACSSATTLEHGQQIHAHIIQCGLESDAFVGSSLLDLYVKCGSLGDAQLVFDRLHKQDAVTWSTLMLGYIHHGHGKEALELFDQMQQDGTEPDQVTFVCLLTACSTIGGLEQGRRIHNDIIAYGLLINSYVGNALVDMYAKCSSLEDARGVFDHLHIRNVVTWSSLISGYAQYGYDQEPFRLFDQMQQQGLQPNEVTYVGILKACSVLEQGRQMHNCIIEHGFELNLLVGSALVDLYVKCGSLLDARIVFDTLTQQNVITWSTLIAGYIQHGLDEEAFQLFEKMQEQGIEPNPITFISSLKACSVLAILERGWWLHTHVIESGLETHIFVGNALIDMYAKCGSLEDACVVFLRMPDRDIVSWTTVLGMYAEDVRGLEGVQVFEQMKQDGIEPNAITYGYILKILTSVAALEQGQQIHACIVESGLESGALIGNALLDIYAKCGRLEDAFMVFERMPKKEVETWSALLMGCALHRDYSSALKIFKGMQCSGLKPDGVMFLCLLSACNFVGLLDESCLHFKAMRDEHGIIPTLEHCNSMVDILGHAGCLDEAEDLLETNPFGANVVGWTSLLNSCKIHVNVGFARRSFDHIVMLDQESSSGYVLMSKVYSHAGMVACAEEIEDMRRYRNGWKKPAHAFIEVDNRVHDFSVGDKLHPQSADIYAKLDVLTVQMKEEGYKPRLDLVLGPMSLEKKEDALCGHSEKLAIAFGLISSPHGSTIRISKNLRMCGDCHNASKFISRIEMREIIVTDTYCIHRFQDGTCSCKDYSYEKFKDETLQTLH